MGPRAKWSGPERLDDCPRCAVTGCDAIAIAILRADPSSAPRVWLVDLELPATGDEVCARHAEALASSEGWTVHDVRSRRARTRAEHSIDASRRSRRTRDVADEVADIDLRRPLASGARDDAMLDARSPLLRRAFAKSRGA